VFTEANIQVYGVSTDPPEEHARFRASLDLPFPLLADEDGAVSEAYDAIAKHGEQRFSARKVVLIDTAGNVAWRDESYAVGSAEAFDAVIAAIRAL
jgi:thioredoxin-dependent peroxiredoxin